MDAQTVTDMILMTDARYAPILILMGVLVPFLMSWLRCKYDKSEADKNAARKDGSAKSSYSTGILGGNGVVAIIGVLATLVIPGLYYDFVGAAQTDGIYLVGLAVAIFFGWFGDKLVFQYIESRRNDAKAEDARAEKKATE